MCNAVDTREAVMVVVDALAALARALASPDSTVSNLACQCFASLVGFFASHGAAMPGEMRLPFGTTSSASRSDGAPRHAKRDDRLESTGWALQVLQEMTTHGLLRHWLAILKGTPQPSS